MKCFAGPEESACIPLMNILLGGHVLIVFTARTVDCFSKPRAKVSQNWRSLYL